MSTTSGCTAPSRSAHQRGSDMIPMRRTRDVADARLRDRSAPVLHAPGWPVTKRSAHQHRHGRVHLEDVSDDDHNSLKIAQSLTVLLDHQLVVEVVQRIR